MVIPTNIANANFLDIERDATKMATEKEKTIPILEKVRNIPDDIPNIDCGEAFITAELLAGKKELAPIPLITLAIITNHKPVFSDRWA